MSRGFMGVSWVFHGVFQALGTICGPGAVLGGGGACASFSQSPPPSRKSEKKHVLCGFMAVSWVFHGVFQALETICGAGADLGGGGGV